MKESSSDENGNGHATIEERVATIEQAIMQMLACLGMNLTKDGEGRIGYQIDKHGPRENWGVLAKILDDLGKVKNEKRIIIPGRN